MRGKEDFAVAVRRADGEIITSVENVESMFAKLKWLKKPFLRGTLALIDAMALGIKALKFATDIALEDATASDAAAKNDCSQEEAKDTSRPKSVNDMTINAMMVVGIFIGLAFFILVPIIFSRLLNARIHVPWELTALEGLFKILLFVGYVVAISFLKDIRRVFQYHGAEHKTINAYEAGEELTVENVSRYTKVHVRCGTSFILVVLVTNIVMYMLVGDHLPHGSLIYKGFINNLIRWAYHIALLPFVAGISYEVIRLAGNCKESILTKLTLLPGLLMQKITTREPDEQMIEVAIASLKGVLDKEAAAKTEA